MAYEPRPTRYGLLLLDDGGYLLLSDGGGLIIDLELVDPTCRPVPAGTFECRDAPDGAFECRPAPTGDYEER